MNGVVYDECHKQKPKNHWSDESRKKARKKFNLHCFRKIVRETRKQQNPWMRQKGIKRTHCTRYEELSLLFMRNILCWRLHIFSLSVSCSWLWMLILFIFSFLFESESHYKVQDIKIVYRSKFWIFFSFFRIKRFWRYLISIHWKLVWSICFFCL